MAAASISLHFHLFSPSSHLYSPRRNDECCFSPKGKSRGWKLLQKQEEKIAAAHQVVMAGFASGMKVAASEKEGLLFRSLVDHIAGTTLRSWQLLYFRARSLRWYFNAEVFLEKAIMNCRFFPLIGVFGSLIGSVLCFFEGCFLVLQSYFEYFCAISKRLDQGDILQLILEAMDMFLVGTAMLMIGMGLYSMFIGNRETPRKIKGLFVNGSNLFGLFHLQMLPGWMQIKSVGEAKSRIGHAVLMLLQAGMVDKLKSVPIVTGMDLACFAAAIFIASASVFLLSQIHSNRTKLKDEHI